VFITFEGIEGCGKSTQAKRLFDRLSALGIPSVLTFEPGSTRAGQDIRRILLDAQNQNLSPLAELLLYEADRAQHVEEVIKPALAQGRWVLCDRFIDATTVYQGHGRRQDLALISMLNEKVSQGVGPDITFVLDCPVEVGLQRALSRNSRLEDPGQDRFEREKRTFHDAVRRGYLAVAGREPERFAVVDATLGENELGEVIFDHLRPFLPEHRGRER
jgi:dTMP kinase